ncbi:hypothetical protein Nepgr_013463 [Nepenthes gracilis]|uniref:Uncharacterized protein n=1 Tax=Nepenthes gracilis TaxID=150966 RepID=A0AAD3XNP7_NEPGR|nr:hypothetical protein Nepgr_013463 [Nepenthes gracilis]
MVLCAALVRALLVCGAKNSLVASDGFCFAEDVFKETWYWAMILPLAENLQIPELQSGHGLGSNVSIDDVVNAGAFCSSVLTQKKKKLYAVQIEKLPVSCYNMLSHEPA